MQQDPWWLWIAVPFGLAAVALSVALLGRLLRRSGVGGHERSSRAGAAALQLQSIFEPSKRHVIEARQRERSESDAQSGDNSESVE
jgi:hypothetical protein